MRPIHSSLLALTICTACAGPRPDPATLVDFTTQQPIGVVFDRLDELSRRCFVSGGLEIESAVFRDTGSGAIELKAADGSDVLAINLKAWSPGQTAVKMTFPAGVTVDRAWLQAMQMHAERGGVDCPAWRLR
jgi:hypothetical protein